MSKDIKIEYLQKLGVYELRELARKLGVPSPTTKTRSVLEQDILKYSKDEVKVTASRKGRPPKSIKSESIEQVLDVFIPKNYCEIISVPEKKQEEDDPAYCTFRCESNYKSIIAHFVAGYVRITNEGKWYMRGNGDAEMVATIPQRFVDRYFLKVGDLIDVEIRAYEGDQIYQVVDVTSVNNQSSDIYQNAKIENGEVVISDNNIEELGIVEGGRLLFVANTVRDSIEKLMPICISLKDRFCVVVLMPNISVYHSLLLRKGFKGDFIFSLSEDHPAVVFETIDNAKNRVDVLLKQGQKVLLVAFDIDYLKSSMEDYLSILADSRSIKEEIEAEKFCMKLLNCARCLESGASVTVVTSCTETEQQTNFVKNLKRSADKVLFL